MEAGVNFSLAHFLDNPSLIFKLPHINNKIDISIQLHVVMLDTLFLGFAVYEIANLPGASPSVVA